VISFAVLLFACKSEEKDAPYMGVAKEEKTLGFSSSAESKYITVNTNRVFTATSNQSWCTTEVLADRTNNLKISVTPNEGNARTAQIVVNAPECVDIRIAVTQFQIPEDTLRILFIGNSFTKDAVEHLPGIVAAAGITNLKMTHMYYGGRTIPEYNSGYATRSDYACYRYIPGTAVWSTHTGYTIKQIIEECQWHVVSFQEHTGNACAWNWTSSEKAAIEELIAKIKSDQAMPPRFAYIMSQAYGDPSFPMIASFGNTAKNVIINNFSSNQTLMFNTIVEQAKKVLAETEVEKIIPTGTVLQNLRATSLNTPMDLTRDSYHMDYGISRYAAACAVFESIIMPEYGINLDGNTYRYSNSNTTPGSYSTPVTDTNAPIALQAARDALANPWTTTTP
jgi:uncharacterized protein YqfB (UPF0267 family)